MRRFIFIIILSGISLIGFAQYEAKYTPSTLMFLSEHRGETSLPQVNKKRDFSLITQLPFGEEEMSKKKDFGTRSIAATEMVGGVEMISAFIGVSDNNFSSLEALGVKIEAKFDKLCTALIPVDQIEALAALDNVTRIEVAEILKPANDAQRTMTKAYDAITNSSAAQALGITSPYTGKGVILGVVDTGIDFQHIAFKDKNGNSRIVRAYKLSSSTSTSLTTYSTASAISGLTYDTNAEDHGTHTSTTAGGSSVIVNGTNVTVTDDHANATYGGMAPEADLVIAGLSSLYTTSIGTAIQNICNYADQVGKPCVISLSLGSQVGPHDGTGSIADIVNQYAGNNHIIVYAASNDGMRADAFVEMGTSNGGGMYASGTSTSSKPMIVNVQRSFSNADGDVEMLMPTITAYARTSGVATSLKFHVVNKSTGEIVYSSSAYSSSTTIDVTGSSGLAQYYKSSSNYQNQYGDAGKIRITRTQDSNNNKYYWQIYCPIMLSTSYADSDGDGVYNSDYAFCVSVYPTNTSSSTTIDMWENAYSWFGTDLNLKNSSSYNYCKGNDECSVSDNACYSKVISVGAYVSKNSITDYAGTAHDYSGEYPNIGDHASFSSWQTAGYGPLGTALPTINAPGARIVAGINHYHTASVDDYSYWSDDYIADLVVNNSNYAYGAMEGTSMATPCASGIIAQWLQACVEAGKTPTPDYIKEVMEHTWDTDQWTNGTGSGAHGAKTFGTHGKINAITGLQYILGVTGGPTIIATPSTVAFDENSYATRTYTKTFSVKGISLEGNITATLTDANGVYSIDKTTITQTGGTAQADITVTWSPATAGTQTATITLKSKNADDVVVSVSGTAKAADPFILAEPATLTFSAGLDTPDTQKFSVMSEFLTQDITVTLNDANGVFSVTPTTISRTASGEGEVEVTVTFSSSVEGTFTGSVVLSSAGASPVTISLSAEANDGGKATDAYLNIAKYATIGDAGWSTSNVNNLYKYTETTGGDAAWLTLPVYGAWVGCYYDSHPQKWIETDVTSTSNKYAGTTWSSSDVLLGSSPYFTSTTARAMGYNSRTNYTQETVTFYVTNTTAVKLLGLGQSRSSSSYPATLKVYECTRNADGTLTAGTTAVKSGSNSATSGTFVLSATDLDAGKIYKVEAATYRSYLCEIGFETPLSKPTLTAAPSSLEFSTTTGVPVTNTFTVKGSNLEEAVTATLTDANGVYSIDAGSISIADAEGGSGKDVTVTFSPTTDGTFTGTVTLGSGGSASATVTLSGVSTTPVLTATPTELTFARIEAESSSSQSFLLQGSNLVGDVTATLADASGVFSLDVTSVGASSAMEGRTVTVTFSPQAEGTYTGSVTLSSPHAADVVVPLSAEASRKFPDYYDLTMGNYGLSTMYLDFPVEIPYDTYDPDLLGVYIAYEIDMDSREVKLARLSRSIPANTGVIVHANSGTYRFPKATGDVDPLRYDNYFSGVTESTLVSKVLKDYSSSAYILTFQRGSDGYVGFYKYTGKRLSAYKAFIVYDPELFTMEVNGFSIAGFRAIGDDLTGIRDLDAVGQDGDWYTIQGMKLNGQPKQRGIYIHNGKTVLVK